MLKGTVFNIQKFSTHDGPGIRTTVFLKGCPLDCIWCHNPESKSGKAEMFFDTQKCTLCGGCVNACQYGYHTVSDNKHIFNRKECVMCGKCASICPVGALEAVGEIMDEKKVMDEVLSDKLFYETSGGGLTLSGGEPMAQFEFSLSLAKAAKEAGISLCIETCGYANAENYKKIAPFTDLFLFDYKETDIQKHIEYTGKSNDIILKNLHMLDELGANIILRCPIIPTLNDRDDHFAGIAAVANSLKNIKEINVEPYHPLGSSKAYKLDKKYNLDFIGFPSENEISVWIEKISKLTDIKVIQA